MSRKLFQGMPKRGMLRRYDAIQEWRYSKDAAESRASVETRIKRVPAKPAAPPRVPSRPERLAAELLVANGALRRRVKELELEISGWRQRVDILEQVIADSYVHEPTSVEVVTIKGLSRESAGHSS